MSFLDDSSSGGSSSEGEGGGKVKGATRKIKLGSSKGGNDDRLQVNEKFAKRWAGYSCAVLLVRTARRDGEEEDK